MVQPLEVGDGDGFERVFAALKQAAPRRSLCAWRSRNECSRKADRGLCVKKSLTLNLQQKRVCRCRWPHVLWYGLDAQLPAGRILRQQNLAACQARRSAGRAADKIRAGDQSQNRQAHRIDDSQSMLYRADRVIK